MSDQVGSSTRSCGETEPWDADYRRSRFVVNVSSVLTLFFVVYFRYSPWALTLGTLLKLVLINVTLFLRLKVRRRNETGRCLTLTSSCPG